MQIFKKRSQLASTNQFNLKARQILYLNKNTAIVAKFQKLQESVLFSVCKPKGRRFFADTVARKCITSQQRLQNAVSGTFLETCLITPIYYETWVRVLLRYTSNLLVIIHTHFKLMARKSRYMITVHHGHIFPTSSIY